MVSNELKLLFFCRWGTVDVRRVDSKTALVAVGNGAAAEGVGILNSVNHAGVSNVRKLLFINSSLYSGLKTNAENEQNAHKKKRNTHATTHFRKLHKWTLLYPPALIKVMLYFTWNLYEINPK